MGKKQTNFELKVAPDVPPRAPRARGKGLAKLARPRERPTAGHVSA